MEYKFVLKHRKRYHVLSIKAEGVTCSVKRFVYMRTDQSVERFEKRPMNNCFASEEDIPTLARATFEYFRGAQLTRVHRIFLQSAYRHVLHVKLRGVLASRVTREIYVNILLDVAVACYIAAITNIDVLDGLKSTASSITQTAATNTATLGIESAAQVIGNAMAGAAISGVVDVAVSSASIYLAKRKRDKGEMTKKEYNVKIKKTVCESGLKFVGGTTGSIIGQALIPVPVVGAFVGGFCGSLIGAGIGKGINYGMFERNKPDGEKPQQSKLFTSKRYRGHVSRIVIFNEKKMRFEVKKFERSNKNYVKNELLKTELKIKPSSVDDTKLFISRWKKYTGERRTERNVSAQRKGFSLNQIRENDDEDKDSPKKQPDSGANTPEAPSVFRTMSLRKIKQRLRSNSNSDKLHDINEPSWEMPSVEYKEETTFTINHEHYTTVFSETMTTNDSHKSKPQTRKILSREEKRSYFSERCKSLNEDGFLKEHDCLVEDATPSFIERKAKECLKKTVSLKDVFPFKTNDKENEQENKPIDVKKSEQNKLDWLNSRIKKKMCLVADLQDGGQNAQSKETKKETNNNHEHSRVKRKFWSPETLNVFSKSKKQSTKT